MKDGIGDGFLPARLKILPPYDRTERAVIGKGARAFPGMRQSKVSNACLTIERRTAVLPW